MAANEDHPRAAWADAFAADPQDTLTNEDLDWLDAPLNSDDEARSGLFGQG